MFRNLYAGTANVLFRPGRVPDPAGIPHPSKAETGSCTCSYAACANLIFPEWVAEQKALYWAILAGLVLVTIFRWVGPRLTAHMEEQRIMREIVEQSRAAEAMGYRNDQISFEVKEGTPQIKIRQ